MASHGPGANRIVLDDSMLKRVQVPRTVTNILHGRSYPKTPHERSNQEALNVKPKAINYKRLSLTPGPQIPTNMSKLRKPSTRAISHNLSYTLRHGAFQQGLSMRTDGFVKVTDLLALPQYHSVDFSLLESIVKGDAKNRYTLRIESGGTQADSVWWIRANQGHSLSNVIIEMTPITDPEQIRLAVHGTDKVAWERIAIQGLSRMGRNHVHFAQGLAGPNVISGMRKSSQVYIYLNVPLALSSGLQLLLSSNGVVLCPGDERGMISPRFFGRVEWAGNRQAMPGWDGQRRTPTPPIPPDGTEDGVDEQSLQTS